MQIFKLWKVSVCVFFMAMYVLSGASSFAQNAPIKVKGKVLDVSGEPLIGATVVIVGIAQGTIAKIDGSYELTVDPNATLKVSFIGYKTVTQAVNGRNYIEFKLEYDSSELGEVQVVAYGSQKKVTVTGAISSIKGAELMKSPIGSVSNMLSGQLNGLTTVQYSGEPGSDAADIFIRGQATWENSSPLIQVDGVERDFNDIDPNEIESISILKDASATAVFGVRGANGVVLITTKRGSTGKAKISVSSSMSVIAPTKTIELANSYQYATFYNRMQLNDHPEYDETELMFQPFVIQKFKDHSDPIRFPDTDWVDYGLHNQAFQTQSNINISGGTERARYFVSAGFYSQGGLFKEFDLPYDLSYQYKRFNYRTNLDLDVTKTTTLSLNLAGNVNNAWKPYTGVGSEGMLLEMYYATPFSSPGLVDGKLVKTSTNYTDVSLPFTGGNGMVYYGNGFMQTSNNTLTTDVQLVQKLDFITEGLNFRVKGSYNSGFTSYVRATADVATYTPVLQSDNSIAYKKSGSDTQLKYEDKDPAYSRNWYMETAVNYDHTFNEMHHVTALALYNQSKKYYPDTYADVPQGYVGLVGRITYDYKSRYMAEFNVGYNGSENFAPGKRFGTFPAGSVGWLISEERFWEPVKTVISFLKLRYTIGIVGNDQIGGSRFMYTADPYSVNNNTDTNRGGYSYFFGIENATKSMGTFEMSKNNADLTWEKSVKTNYGIDIKFLNDKLRFTYDYYNEKRKDILLTDGTAPSILGFKVPMANLGKVDSWGWEASMKLDQQVNEDLRYSVAVNLMYNQNKVIQRKEAPLNNEFQYNKDHRIGSRLQYQFMEYYDEGNTEASYLARYGETMPEQLTALKNGDCVYVDLDHNGYIDSNDKTRDLGYTDDPEYLAGVNLGLTWKKFDFSMQWTGAWNVTRTISSVFRKPFTDRNNANQGGLLVYQVENTWTEENPDPNAEYPRATFDNGDINNYVESDLWEKDAKYLRLKNMQVAYNFDLPFMHSIKLKTCQLSLSGYNLITFSPYIWGDPESKASSSPTYPLTRTFSLNLKLSF